MGRGILPSVAAVGCAVNGCNAAAFGGQIANKIVFEVDVIDHGGGYRTGDWMINNDVTQYTEGTLVIDFLDRKKRMIVFRGIGQGAVTTSERNAIAIRDAVQKIVADFPR